MSKKGINEIITNKSSITIDTARLLSKAFGTSPQFWINADTNYRLRLNKEMKKEKETGSRAEIFKHMPIREMIRKGWLEDYKDFNDLINKIKKFWQSEKINFSFMEKTETPNFRKSIAYHQSNTYYALCWYEMAKKCAKKFKVLAYIEKNLSDLAEKIPYYSAKNDGIEDFLNALNASGVKFFVLSHLQKTYLDGASFYDEENPVIVYSGRYNRTDHFWFTVAHEIAHILLHLSKDKYFLDNLETIETDVEREADSSAVKMLLVEDILNCFEGRMRYISETQVEECRDQLQVDPAIIVGVLQHYGKLSRRNLNRFKKKVLDLIPKQYFIENSLIVK